MLSSRRLTLVTDSRRFEGVSHTLLSHIAKIDFQTLSGGELTNSEFVMRGSTVKALRTRCLSPALYRARMMEMMRFSASDVAALFGFVC